MPLTIGQTLGHGFDEPLGLLTDCHRRIESFLEVLIAIDRNAAGGAITPGQQAELEGAIRYFAHAAPKHTADEEESVFPRLRTSDDARARQALDILARLEQDHDEAHVHHRTVDRLVRQWLANGHLDSPDAATLRAHLIALQTIYRDHIAVEDREIFPAAGRALSAQQLREIGREMAARRAAPPQATPREPARRRARRVTMSRQ